MLRGELFENGRVIRRLLKVVTAYVLNSKFSPLQNAFNVSFGSLEVNEQVAAHGIHTARTLNKDVLPAFCSPIIVMSISAALFAHAIISISERQIMVTSK
jgi:hypothetical protein